MADVVAQPAKDCIRLIIIDDHAMFRESISDLLNRHAHLSVLASFGETHSAT